MKTFSTQVRVGAEHIDRGNHANWRAQLAIVEDVHFSLRQELGLGLEQLRENCDLFLMMYNVKDIFYRKELRLGDMIDVEIVMWISGRTCLEFRCLFKKDREIATEMSWVMPLVSVNNGRPHKIPQWMIDAIGVEKPDFAKSLPALAVS